MKQVIEIPCTSYTITADLHLGSSERVALVLMGFRSTRSRQEGLAQSIVTSTGMSVVTIDYSGHGDSEFDLKDTKPAQHVLEVMCTFDWIRKQYPKAEISIIGSSYGGFLAAHVPNYRPVKNLVLRAPAIYKPSAFYDFWSVRFSDEDAYRSDLSAYRNDEEQLRRHPLLTSALTFQGNALVITHEDDEIIPSITTDAFAKAFNAEAFLAERFTHAVSQSPVSKHDIEKYQNFISQWLNAHA